MGYTRAYLGQHLACVGFPAYRCGVSTMMDYMPEPDTTEVARRLRMFMGDKKLTRKGLALQSGIARSSLATKLDGEVEFTVPEIVRIAHAIGKSWLWVLTGVDPQPHPDGGGEGRPAPVPVTSRDTPTSGLWISSTARPALIAA